MSVITEPQALLPLDAPLPQPRRYTLLDAAQTIDPAEDRWLAGAWISSYPAGEPHTFDPCSSGTSRVKDIDARVDRPMAGAFTVYVGGSCTGSSIGPRVDEYRRRLLAGFMAVESTAVERTLATGDHHGGSLGAYLGDTNMERLAAGTVTPTEGLALLEDEIAAAGGNGLIHVPPATATYWIGQTLISPDRQNQLRTGLGTLVAVGAGYRDVRPDDYQGLVDGQEWAFATGPVGYIRDPQPEIIPGGMREALDRSSNEATFIAERSYVVAWVGRQDTEDDNHVQAGVLIDRLN